MNVWALELSFLINSTKGPFWWYFTRIGELFGKRIENNQLVRLLGESKKGPAPDNEEKREQKCTIIVNTICQPSKICFFINPFSLTLQIVSSRGDKKYWNEQKGNSYYVNCLTLKKEKNFMVSFVDGIQLPQC